MMAGTRKQALMHIDPLALRTPRRIHVPGTIADIKA